MDPHFRLVPTGHSDTSEITYLTIDEHGKFWTNGVAVPRPPCLVFVVSAEPELHTPGFELRLCGDVPEWVPAT